MRESKANVNGKINISAGEINKFTYCPYQWYYERVYGHKTLREMYRKQNPEYAKMVLENPNIKKGQKFHKRYKAAEKRRLVLRVFAAAIVFLIVCALAFAFYKYKP